MKNKTDKIALAAGCFWGVQAYFKQVPGVINTTAGYAGGQIKNLTYEQVSTGRTGLAEAVLIEYDPKQVTLEKLLRHFWQIHDPTSLNKQGNDRGTQYRSAIFCFSPDQLKIAQASKEKLEQAKKYQKPIVTEIKVIKDFYPAEAYHQDYLKKNPGGYCHINLNLVKKIN